MKPLRILVVDDHHLVRRGVKTMLLAHGDWEVCGEANTGREAIGISPYGNAPLPTARLVNSLPIHMALCRAAGG